MYLQFNKSKGKNGKEYQSVLLCKKFRDKETGKPKTEVVLNLSKYGLDNKTMTALKKLFKLDIYFLDISLKILLLHAKFVMQKY